MMSKSPQTQTLLKVIELCDGAIDRCAERMLAARACGDTEAEAWQSHLKIQYQTMKERLVDSIQSYRPRGDGSRDSGDAGSAPHSTPPAASGAAG